MNPQPVQPLVIVGMAGGAGAASMAQGNNQGGGAQ
jgi:hypothetical protein